MYRNLISEERSYAKNIEPRRNADIWLHVMQVSLKFFTLITISRVYMLKLES
jgi:hypothetical protein